jgi:Tfp pilus assembly protein PilF
LVSILKQLLVFSRHLKINPDCSEAQRNLGYAQAHTSLGVAYLSQGDSKKALDEFRKALRIDSHYADAHYNLALLLQKQGQLQEAVGHYQEAIKYDPSSAAAHNNLGVALMQMGNKQQAESEYKEALRIKADFKDAKLNLDELQKN